MNISTQRIAVLAIALLVATSGVGAAAVAWDTETTNTPTESDVDGSTTSVTVHHGDGTNATWYEVTVDDSSLNYTLQFRTDDDLGAVLYENDSAEVTDSTNNHIAWNVTHDELADLPRDVDGTEVNATIVNESADGNPVELSETLTLTTGNDNPTAVMQVTDDAGEPAAAASNLLADTLETGETFGWWGAEKYWSDNGTDTSSFSGWTTVNGSATTVEVHMVNSTAASAYGAQIDDAEDGDWVKQSTLHLNGKPVKVYAESAPDDVGSEEDHAVYQNETDTLEITMQSEELEDTTTLYVRGSSSDGYGFNTLWSELGEPGAAAASVVGL